MPLTTQDPLQVLNQAQETLQTCFSSPSTAVPELTEVQELHVSTELYKSGQLCGDFSIQEVKRKRKTGQPIQAADITITDVTSSLILPFLLQNSMLAVVLAHTLVF